MQENKINIQISEITKVLFKKRNFDFITVRKGEKHKKQQEALELLTDNETQELLYGGAAGGAKSWTGCVWLMFNCLLYPKTKWFIGREELKRITESTLITFYKVAQEYHITQFKFNAQKNVIIFNNGSRIDLLELKKLPRDPMYERFGSTEYTGGWIEEASEINFGAFDILRTRIGRQYNDKYNIEATIFLTCNPTKKWLYNEFFKPDRNGELNKGYKRFIQAYVQDNPFIEHGYIERLSKIKNKTKKERLLKGNWDYDDNPFVLCAFEKISAIFENNHIALGKQKYITADVARFGSDKARIGVWDDWTLIETISFDKSKTTLIQSAINALRAKHNIPKHFCIADEDGVGGGVVDNCGILGFVNNSKPFKERISKNKDIPNYENLQVQCLFGLAEKINTFQINITADISPNDRELIIEELGTIEQKQNDSNKLSLVKKQEIKENIGRSPDWRDLLLMRKYFDYKNQTTLRFLK